MKLKNSEYAFFEKSSGIFEDFRNITTNYTPSTVNFVISATKTFLSQFFTDINELQENMRRLIDDISSYKNFHDFFNSPASKNAIVFCDLKIAAHTFIECLEFIEFGFLKDVYVRINYDEIVSEWEPKVRDATEKLLDLSGELFDIENNSLLNS